MTVGLFNNFEIIKDLRERCSQWNIDTYIYKDVLFHIHLISDNLHDKRCRQSGELIFFYTKIAISNINAC